ARIVPRRRGPSNVPPSSGAIRRVPLGTAPRFSSVETFRCIVISSRVFIIVVLSNVLPDARRGIHWTKVSTELAGNRYQGLIDEGAPCGHPSPLLSKLTRNGDRSQMHAEVPVVRTA